MLSLVVTESVIADLQKRFDIREHNGDWRYYSPNGMIQQNLFTKLINGYGRPSHVSFPTSEIEKFPLISEDAMDYYNFSKSFELETTEQFINRLKNKKGEE